MPSRGGSLFYCDTDTRTTKLQEDAPFAILLCYRDNERASSVEERTVQRIDLVRP